MSRVTQARKARRDTRRARRGVVWRLTCVEGSAPTLTLTFGRTDAPDTVPEDVLRAAGFTDVWDGAGLFDYTDGTGDLTPAQYAAAPDEISGMERK